MELIPGPGDSGNHDTAGAPRGKPGFSLKTFACGNPYGTIIVCSNIEAVFCYLNGTGIYQILLNMKILLLLIFPFLLLSPVHWLNDMGEAKLAAQKDHKHILLNFSGSDWCGPCIRMHREIFDNEAFKMMADTDLVLVNADFPRMKKNQLPARQQEINNAMADQYNPQGKFPFTVLLNANGKVLRQWDGFPNGNAENFTLEVRNGIYADR